MSYLQGPSLSGFAKCIISFWFRVPQASLDAVTNEYNDFWNAWQPGDPDPPPLLGLVPLVVFGKEGTSRITADQQGSSQQLSTTTTENICVMQADAGVYSGTGQNAGDTFTGTAWPECNTSTSTRYYGHTDWTYSPIPGTPTGPSYVAIDQNGNLQINFESAKTANAVLAYGVTSSTSAYYTQESVNLCYTFSGMASCAGQSQTTVSSGGLAGVLELAFAAIGWHLQTAVIGVVIDEGSSGRVNHPYTATYGPVPGDWGTGAIGISPPGLAGLTADTWHHVLVSVDLSGGCSATGYAVGEQPSANNIQTSILAYIAVDDVNYTTGGYPFDGTNKVYTEGAGATAFSGQAVNYIDNGDGTYSEEGVGPVPSYSLDGMSVPGAAIGVPATRKYVDNVHHVEMGELQIWTGQSFDTSNQGKRRLFIDSKGKPENPKTAAQALGKPDVLLHGSGNWIKGKDTGILGDFDPTGTIKKYTPDPSLYGPQG